MAKKGRMNEDEHAFIAANAAHMSIESIASKLDRTPETVAHFIRIKGVSTTPSETLRKEQEISEIRDELKSSERWGRLRQELARDELKFFEEEYVKLYAQFRNDVTASETSQIFDAIKLDILKSRNLVERKKVREYIGQLEKRQLVFVETNGPNPADWNEKDRDYLNTLEATIKEQKAEELSKYKEYDSLQGQHNALIRTLKGTRDQRFKDVENSKESFLGLLKRLQQKEIAELEGRETGLMQMAADKEYSRLGQLHQYEDGQLDRPILSHETVDLADEP